MKIHKIFFQKLVSYVKMSEKINFGVQVSKQGRGKKKKKKASYFRLTIRQFQFPSHRTVWRSVLDSFLPGSASIVLSDGRSETVC